MTSKTPSQLDESICRVTDAMIACGVLASRDYQVSMPSTNSVALEWLGEQRGDSDATATLLSQTPRLVIAESQTAGRGRRGRAWQAQGDGLAFSLVLADCHPLLSIAVGVAVAEAIEHVAGPVRCGLKWPNDVAMGGTKVAGTLIERIDLPSAADGYPQPMSVIGIGLNVGSSPRLDGAQATSVCEASGKWVTRTEVLEELLPAVMRNAVMCESDPGELLQSFRERCVLTGEVIGCTIDGHIVQGRCEGIDDRGELQVWTEAGMRVCRSGEVSRVRIS
ncbi:biotin--[acetyl-CoA-carboxylase] ligase [Allorhodopirellula heiligendammensis]|uniref:biotin--[biotin carboxyl-carrier protein] ligase n=1 Tax=Allorhodopirellula heiligendammensis TaxID=2714739 RepID=A0A5C6BVK7_9BACT|nr:biotin--[acetyl-CoA-carboxylase] ligase [Allorhodopirellula heiligendammensis]TWU16075.1 Bifunctional ligase/repressor BirA [Allorhodopirellula heiligendammensis]